MIMIIPKAVGASVMEPLGSICSVIEKEYVQAGANNINYTDNGGNGLRMYVPKNENLRPVVAELVKNADGAARVFLDCPGEDIPGEVLAHSRKFLNDEGKGTYGITGADFVLNVLYNPYMLTDGEIPADFRDFCLFSTNGDATKTVYESPLQLLQALDMLRSGDKKMGIVSQSGDIFFIDPLHYGKLPDFCLLGPMYDRLLDYYDNLATSRSTPAGVNKRYLNGMVRRVMKSVKDSEMTEDFSANKYNTPEALKLRFLARKLLQEDIEAASDFFGFAIEPFVNKDCDIFCEGRFEHLARAATQYVLNPIKVRDTGWQVRTRAIEGAQLRHYTEAEKIEGNGHFLVWELVESGASATAKGLEPYASIGRVPPVRIHVQHNQKPIPSTASSIAAVDKISA